MLWQKRARLFVLAIAVGVVAVVFLTTRRREEPPPAKPLERGDPAATIESSGAFVVQVKGDRETVRVEAEKRGYLVIGVAAPNGELFFESGARIFPAFLKQILSDYKIRDGKFHVAGPSNGGIASFHVAALNPQYFLSVTAFPGYMWQPNNAKLTAISKMCVFMYVGETDEYMWHDEMRREAEFLRGRGTVARYTVEKGQPHRLETLADAGASRLFDGFEEAKKGCSR